MIITDASISYTSVVQAVIAGIVLLGIVAYTVYLWFKDNKTEGNEEEN